MTMGEIAQRIAELEDRDPQVRMYAATWLGNVREPDAIPHLSALLDDSDWRVAVRSIDALGKIGDVRAIPALFEASEDCDVNAYTEIAFALVRIANSDKQKTEEAIGEIVRNGASDHDPRRRKLAAFVFMRLEHPACVPHLIAGLHDEIKEVRANCMSGLLALVGKTAIDMSLVSESLSGWVERESAASQKRGEAANAESWEIYRKIKNASDANEARKGGVYSPGKPTSPPGKTPILGRGRYAI